MQQLTLMGSRALMVVVVLVVPADLAAAAAALEGMVRMARRVRLMVGLVVGLAAAVEGPAWAGRSFSARARLHC